VRDDTQALVDALNEFVSPRAGDYLAKDHHEGRALRAMERRLDRFLEVRRKWTRSFSRAPSRCA
jgi:hypothetical protein